MIYTVGIRMKYERAFAAGPVVKSGRTEIAEGRVYPGGFAFLTAEDAARFLRSRGLSATHMVMGLVADWDKDTAPEEGQPYRRLVRDAEVVKL